MKPAMKILGCIVFLFFSVFLLQENMYAQSDWKNWYGIAWRDTPANTIKYAKQMGYDYIAAKTSSVDTYRKSPDAAGLRFIIVDPHFNGDVYADLPNRASLGTSTESGRVIDTAITYTDEQKNWYNQRMVWKSTDPFPNNFAPGYFPDNNNKRFSVMWDVQQQAVIDELIGKIMQLFKRSENPGLPFTFAGYGVDVPMLAGDFRYWNGTSSYRTTLAHWTGTDSGLVHDTITHEFPTYSDGMAGFYKQLNIRMRQDYPDAKWVIEPARIYDSSGTVSGDEWIYSIKNRTDKDELTPELLLQEGAVTDFVDNSNNFNSGVNITKDMVGCSQNSAVEENVNRLIAGKAGIDGAWYDWFGRFGGSKTMPNFQSVVDVYPRLKLIRCVPNWDNLNNIPLASRSWDGIVYQSPNSYVSSDVIYSRHPKTGKLFVVFLTNSGVVRLNDGETITNVSRADGYFMQSEDGSGDIDITGNEIRLKSSMSIVVDTSNGQVKGNGYIFTLSTSMGIPTVITDSATNIKSDAAILNGTVNANGLSTTVWFEYGTKSITYDNKTLVQQVTGSDDTAVSNNLTELLSGKTYYYRIVGQNDRGIVYGSEKIFKTPDVVPPVCTVVINDNSTYTKTRDVTLNISATDNVGVTGYYISPDSTIPSVSDPGWTSVTTTANYTANIPYTLSSEGGAKMVYVWCKDAAGNVSNTASDTIEVDSIAPVITITSPTSEVAYTTNNSVINLGGSASDGESGVSNVTWISDKGGSGEAVGTTNWMISEVNLSLGDTVVAITAMDNAGNTRIATITITYGIVPTATTAPATEVTVNSARLHGTVNAGGLSTTVWFEYGTMSGIYDNTTSIQNVTGTNDEEINAAISGLLEDKTYYYRLVAQNSAGTKHGSEMTLKTLDTTAPVGSIIIKGGDEYSNTMNVTITLNATDNAGITGYYLSASDATPSTTGEGWTTIAAATNYSTSVSYILSSVDGSKTVYAWFKDASGNMSSIVSDSIILDTVAPVVTITNPTSDATYTTTNNTVSLGGSVAESGSGVSRVIWSNDKGGSGAAGGTTNWMISDISLSNGNTVITVTATDGAGNTGSDTIAVTVSGTGLSYGLKAFYAFNEGSGATAYDTSGNGNNGVISGATWTTGKIKGGLKFNGTSSYVSIPPVNSDEMSISAWFYKNAKDKTNVDAILGAWTWNSNIQLQEGFDIRFSPSAPDTLEFVLITQSASGSRVMKTTKKNLGNSVGKWFFVVGVYSWSTGEQRLYINGQLVNKQTHSPGNTVVPMTYYPDMRIGYSRVNNGYFNGILDEVRFYNRVLSNQEVIDLYNAK